MPEQTEVLLDYPEAAALIQAHAAAPPAPARTESLAIGLALGHCLAQEIVADRNQPPFHRSTRDGYAVRAVDLERGQPLILVGSLRAGQPALTQPVGPCEAVEIMTGAPMPTGADAVLMVEHAALLRSSTSRMVQAHAGRALSPGENVVPAGSEARRGSVIVAAGVRLTPMHIGAAVAAGAASMTVYKQPRIAILATGDELVEPGQPALPHQIRNSNTYSLAAQVERAGGIPVPLPIVRDNVDDLRAAIELALQCDLVLLSGGVSMGKYDLVEPVLRELRAQFFFTGVRMQPGKPIVFGRMPVGISGKYFFGLPGNPVSTMVTFALFAGPLLRALGGEADAHPLFTRARLATDLERKAGLTRFLPALLETAWDRANVTPVAWQGSGDLAATARSNCFVVAPPEKGWLRAGEDVSVLLAYQS